jgi:hypothetical protein
MLERSQDIPDAMPSSDLRACADTGETFSGNIIDGPMFYFRRGRSGCSAFCTKRRSTRHATRENSVQCRRTSAAASPTPASADSASQPKGARREARAISPPTLVGPTQGGDQELQSFVQCKVATKRKADRLVYP